ncbi:Asp-tRNA(Asn)/Glu-tRNA(Gln) amidotransferase subunit GatC [Vagococcus sp. CY53-2]|uniref:Asp-tRNA(Asn)/Glu-tRNA(Gln) amidotransferase subunit GatC n=1 Tax=Vagococcus sp. CY53-2 TaxID=2925780 RepID=UPI001F507255|nr:Asp-tRNA(Asn)/Glu-tRNA(Gln) amidotransferase subunit GatC [Vagococcus sp. CY53-2]MCI0129872.1 Asp-tRNA(Asn)/Glu-tRNA(Gln) amidotransferase subunit GatC [Vagococcus sp. CY53-2]
MTISKEEVLHVAKLSKLRFSDSELDEMTKHLGKVTDMMANLSQVDTTDVPFTSSVTEETNVFREDIAVKGESRDELFSNVPETQDGYIKVPAIMDNGEAGA